MKVKKSNIFKLIDQFFFTRNFLKILQKHLALDPKAKTEYIRTRLRRVYNYSTLKQEHTDMKMIATSTEGMNPVDAAIIEETKCEIRAKYRQNQNQFTLFLCLTYFYFMIFIY